MRGSAPLVRCSPGHCSHGANRPIQLAQVVTEANDAPLGGDLGESTQRELPKPQCLFDLAEDRFGYQFATHSDVRVDPIGLAVVNIAFSKVARVVGGAFDLRDENRPQYAYKRSAVNIRGE